MAYPKIEILRNIEFYNGDYASSFIELANVINRLIDNEPLMDECLDFCATLYEDWDKTRDSENYNCVLPNTKLYEFINQSKFKGLKELQEGTGFYTLEYLVSYCIGILCKNWENNEAFIQFLYDFSLDNDWRGLLQTYTPSADFIERFIHSEYFAESRLLEALERRRHIGGNDFIEYYNGLSLDEKIKYLNSPNFEGEWFMLYEYVDFIGTLLKEKGAIKQYAGFLYSYSLPQIQYQILQSIHDPENVIELYREISSIQEDGNKKTLLQYVILNYWYKLLVRLNQYCAIPLSRNKNNEVVKFWKDVVARFHSRQEEYIRDAFTAFIETLSTDAFSQWLFSKKPSNPPRPNIESEESNKFLTRCKRHLMQSVGKDLFNPEITDLAYISSFIEFPADSEMNGDYISTLYKSILNGLIKDKYYLSGELDNNLINRIAPFARLVARYISHKSADEWSREIKSFNVRFEGINIGDYSHIFESVRVECQFLLVFLYASIYFEDKELGRKVFNLLSTHSLRQSKYCSNRHFIDNYYQKVLDLAELVADQCLPEAKEKFESDFVDILYDPISGINTFAKSQTRICGKAYNWIEHIQDKEWPIIKKRLESKMMHRYASDLEKLLHYILERK